MQDAWEENAALRHERADYVEEMAEPAYRGIVTVEG